MLIKALLFFKFINIPCHIGKLLLGASSLVWAQHIPSQSLHSGQPHSDQITILRSEKVDQVSQDIVVLPGIEVYLALPTPTMK